MSALLYLFFAVGSTSIGFLESSKLADRLLEAGRPSPVLARRIASLCSEPALALAWTAIALGIAHAEWQRPFSTGPAMAVIGACAIAMTARSHLATARRMGRIRKEATAILADDIEARVGIGSKRNVLLACYGPPEVHVGADLDPKTLRALKDLIRREGQGRKFELKIEMHPLPASATLRAAIAAQGHDPMRPRPPAGWTR